MCDFLFWQSKLLKFIVGSETQRSPREAEGGPPETRPEGGRQGGRPAPPGVSSRSSPSSSSSSSSSKS